MLKVEFEYGDLFGGEEKGIKVLVYNKESSSDGTHIASTSVFHAGMLKNLDQNAIDALTKSLTPAIEVCISDVIKRMQDEKLI